MNFESSKMGLAALLISGLISGCGSRQESTSDGPSGKSQVRLEDVQSESGCLNLPAYLRDLKNLDPQLPLLKISTDLKATSKKSIRPNFLKTLAYGTFVYEGKTVGSMNDFAEIEQDACQSLTLKAADGSSEVYKITESSSQRIRAQKEAGLGEAVDFLWLSPRSLQVTSKYVVYDAPCSRGDTEILAEHSVVYDWNSGILRNSPTVPIAIDRTFLSLIADTVGYNVQELYALAPASEPGADDASTVPQNRVLSTKLSEMLALGPRDEVLECWPGSTVTPEPNPSPNPGPVPAPDDGSDGSDEDNPSGNRDPEDPAIPEDPNEPIRPEEPLPSPGE